MKLLVTFVLLTFGQFGFCQSKPEVSDKDFDKLSWLEGTWVRTNAKPGRSGTEWWVKGKDDNELIGTGISLRGTDTTFVEKLKLVVKQGSIYYVSDVPENPEPVDFKITSIDSNGFACENPSHDFPKKISYRRDGNRLRAVTSGDGKEIEFLFERKSD